MVSFLLANLKYEKKPILLSLHNKWINNREHLFFGEWFVECFRSSFGADGKSINVYDVHTRLNGQFFSIVTGLNCSTGYIAIVKRYPGLYIPNTGVI